MEERYVYIGGAWRRSMSPEAEEALEELLRANHEHDELGPGWLDRCLAVYGGEEE